MTSKQINGYAPKFEEKLLKKLTGILSSSYEWGGRVVRRCWVNFQCRGVLLIWIVVGQGPTALAVGGGCLDIFILAIISLFFLPLSGRRPDID